MTSAIITTPRLALFALEERHFAPLAAMHLDPEVMATLGGFWDEAKTRRAFERYVAAFARDGVSRFAVEDHDGNFLGLAGVLRHHDPAAPPGLHDEIGWRFIRPSWGQGYATEAAAATLAHAFDAYSLREIWAYTTADNMRSQSVMAKIGMARDMPKDFTLKTESGRVWDLKVWTAERR